MEFYCALKRKKLLIHATTWINPIVFAHDFLFYIMKKKFGLRKPLESLDSFRESVRLNLFS